MQSGESLSTLHLNRREVQDCLIAAGIDLLARFYAGSDRSGKVADRIIQFAKQFVFTGQPSAQTFADVLNYGCRNPMLHSFTVQNTRFRISLTNDLPSGAIWKPSPPVDRARHSAPLA